MPRKMLEVIYERREKSNGELVNDDYRLFKNEDEFIDWLKFASKINKDYDYIIISKKIIEIGK